MNKPLVSVIMSVYNTDQKYLEESIDSILNQSYSNFEFIIIDDASSYDIGNLINRYQDPRIHLHRNSSNKGLTASLNIAIELSRGDYIARMDADDISIMKRLEMQMGYLFRNPQIGVLGSNGLQFGDTRKKLKRPQKHEMIKARMLVENPMIHSTIVMKKSLIKKFKYDENCVTAQDYDLWSRLVWETEFANLNECLIKYRVHNNQITQKKKKSQDDVANKVRVSMLNRIINESNDFDIQLFIRSLSLEPLKNEEEILKLKNFYKNLLMENKKTNIYSQRELLKILTESYDRALYLYVRENRKYPNSTVMKPLSYKVNKYSTRKYLALIYKDFRNALIK